MSGDVGNRTRVRKIRPSNIYERSRLEFSLEASRPTKAAPELTAETRKPLFRTLSDMGVRHSAFFTPDPTTGQRAGWADVTPLRGQLLKSLAYAARGRAA